MKKIIGGGLERSVLGIPPAIGILGE